MANLTLTKEQSALINAGRQQVTTQVGDMWRILPGRVTDPERFGMASEYNDLEEQVDSIIDGGGHVFIEIGKAPNRPKPPTS